MALLVPASWAASACTLDTSGKDACRAQRDCLDGHTCVEGTCVRDASWECLGTGAGEPSDEPVGLRLVLLDEATEAPVAGARVRACVRTDRACAAPRFDGTTGAAGAVELALADEFLELTAAGYRDTLAMGAGSLEVTTAGVEPLEVHFDLRGAADFAAFAGDAGVEPVEGRGDVEVLVRDCTYESAGGVRVELGPADAATERRYLQNDLPSVAATETDTASGSALLFNVPPGLPGVTGTVASTEASIGEAQAVIVRAGWLSHVAVLPAGVGITDAQGDQPP